MSNSKNTTSLDITNESLSEYLRNRYPDRSFDDFPRSLSELVGELRGGDFKTIGDVRKDLDRTQEAAKCFETENPPSKNIGSRYSAIGIVIISMALLRGNDFFTFRTVLDKCSPENLEKYRKYILPEIDESQPMED